MTMRKLARAVQEIEDQAWSIVDQFRRTLIRNGQPVPEIPPVPLMDIVSQFAGLDLQAVKDLRDEGRSLSGRLDAQLGLISYAADEIASRQAFSIAHELGHFYLHYLPSQAPPQQACLFENQEPSIPPYYRCATSDVDQAVLQRSWTYESVAGERVVRTFTTEQARLTREIQANQFAAALLMPAHLVAQLIRADYSAPRALANQLGVSVLAAEVRLEFLGYRVGQQNERQNGNSSQSRLF